MAERIEFIANEDCKLKDSVPLRFGDGTDDADPTTGDASIVHNGTDLTIDNDTGHTVLTSPDAGDKQVRINNKTFDATSGDVMAFQAKPGAADGTVTLYGGQISPRFNDGVGGATIVGLHVDTYLKGDEGDLSGDVRGLQTEIVDDNASGRTIAGNVIGQRFRLNLSATVTGDALGISFDANEGSIDWEALLATAVGTAAALHSSSGAALPNDVGWLRVKVGSTFYKVALYNDA